MSELRELLVSSGFPCGHDGLRRASYAIAQCSSEHHSKRRLETVTAWLSGQDITNLQELKWAGDLNAWRDGSAVTDEEVRFLTNLAKASVALSVPRTYHCCSSTAGSGRREPKAKLGGRSHTRAE